MENKTIHLVAFNIPFPANYGGAIDVFYKLKALHDIGIKVILHCFLYNRKPADELHQFAIEVNYYERSLNPLLLLSKNPYIIASRKNKHLNDRLLKDEHPILLEGLHCCGILDDIRFNGRKILIRSHNIEHDYYEHLALVEQNPFKKLYFIQEAKKLKSAEKKYFPLASEILGISDKDTNYLQQNYRKGLTVSAFHEFENITVKIGIGTYAFYHGNLAIGENNEAALFLVNEVFSKISYPLIIAGSNPSQALIDACEKHSNLSLKANISSTEIMELLENAQMNVLPTFQSTGIKLKLLAALFKGRHCLVNPPMIIGTGLENLCVSCDSAENFLKEIKQYQNQAFSEQQILERQSALSRFNNKENAFLLSKIL